MTANRLYEDGEQRKDSTSLGSDDLPLLAKATNLAHTWIYMQSQKHANLPPQRLS